VFLILILLPLFAFCIFAWRVMRHAWAQVALIAAVTAAVVSSILTLVLLSGNPWWAGRVQLAWTDVASDRAGAPLKIGGSKQDLTIGWPNGRFTPEVVATKSADKLELAVSGGGGFILSGERALTGIPIPRGEKIASGNYCVHWERIKIVRRKMFITDCQGGGIGDFTLTAGDGDRVVPLSAVVGSIAIRLRTENKALQARDLEQWASQRWILARRGEGWGPLLLHWITFERWNVQVAEVETPRILSDADQYPQLKVNGSNPKIEVLEHEMLHILWPTRSQYFRYRIEDTRIAIEWMAPWNRNSPPPPESDERPVSMVVCAFPLPGDNAFILPFGTGLSGVRQRLFIFGDKFVQRAEHGAPVLSEYAPVGSDVTRKDRAESSVVVKAEPFQVRLTSLSDIPGSWYAGFLLALSILAFGLASWLFTMSAADEHAWLLNGLGLSLWTMLLLRFVMALRYALDPGAMDLLAARGVENAALALVLMPGIMLFVAAGLKMEGGVPADLHQRGRLVLACLLGWILAACIVTLLVRRLWPSLPSSRFFPTFTFLWSGRGIIACLLLMLFAIPVVRAHFDPLTHGSRWWKLFRNAMFFPLEILERAVPRAGKRIWESAVINTEPGVRLTPEQAGRSKDFWPVTFVLGIVLAVSLAALFGLQFVLPPSTKIVQEVVAPLVFFWVPAGLLIGVWQVWFPGAAPPAWVGLKDKLSLNRVVIIVGIIFLSVFLLPLATHDAGGLIAASAVFIAVITVLVGGGRPFAVPSLALILLSLTLASASFVYLNLDPMTPTPGAFGESRVRLLVFRDNAKLKEGLAWFSLRQEESSGVISEQKVSNALEHTWENQAIAHEGGWFGLGFGKAPVRRSLVQQNTVQCDSQFSFFLMSEHGVLGGLGLLLAYLCPAFLVVSAARSRGGIGMGLALAIGMAFFLEACFHALMNLGGLPFTGRDLPLLAVNSRSNLVRWTVFLTLLAQAVSWRKSGPLAVSQTFSSSAWRRLTVATAGVSLMFLSLVTWRAVSVAGETTVAAIFDWSPLLREINKLGVRHDLTYNPKTHRIEFKKPAHYTGTTLLEQEIERFNALADEEKREGLLVHHPANYARDLAKVTRIEEWDQLMDRLRLADQTVGRSLRPSLLRLTLARPSPGEGESIGDSTPDAAAAAKNKGSDPLLPDLEEPLEVRGNPEYDTRLTFRAPADALQLPVVRWAGVRSGAVSLRGKAFEIIMPLDSKAQERAVSLVSINKAWRLASGSNQTESRKVRLFLRGPDGKAPVTVDTGTFEASRDRVVYRPGDVTGRKLISWWPWADRFKKGDEVILTTGQRISVQATNGSGLSGELVVGAVAQSSLIGPAWVQGQWTSVFNPDERIPWTAYLAQAVRNEADREKLGSAEAELRYGALTLDAEMQQAAQSFMARKGRTLHATRIRSGQDAWLRLPPRVALSIIRIPNGEAIALGGWPRMSSMPGWKQERTGEWVPPVSWMEEHAPASISAHYGSDRNFQRMLMGSTTKPLWASVVLGLHPGLASSLAVRGVWGPEKSVFGIPIRGPGWHAPDSRSLNGTQWCDLTSFLATSDNRYQVRLGILGLAEPGQGGKPADAAQSSSTDESMNGGGSPWSKVPQFPLEIRFSHKNPGVIGNLADTPLAERWRQLFQVGIRSGDMSVRRSFWTADERDDRKESGSGSNPTAAFDVISPQAPDLALDGITMPRQYVSLLLGGGTNVWSNVDFAGAFATAVTGRPVIPHITERQVHPSESRIDSLEQAKLIRPGLERALTHPHGTAYEAFRRILPRFRNYSVYAKTGTLRLGGIEPTSRIAVAIVRWDSSGNAKGGVVFSVVAERGGVGTAAQWLAEFISENPRLVDKFLDAK